MGRRLRGECRADLVRMVRRWSRAVDGSGKRCGRLGGRFALPVHGGLVDEIGMYGVCLGRLGYIVFREAYHDAVFNVSSCVGGARGVLKT